MPKAIKENALFIADAHYPHHGDEFLELLKKLDKAELQIPQLFLMGDIFDLLFGHNEYIKKFSKDAIELLQKVSKQIEVIYLEGNHDFCLKELFPNIEVYSREQQPLHCHLKKQDVYLSHGDKYETKFGFNCYSKILRNKTTLNLLRPFEKQIINYRMEKLKRKKICGKFTGYKKRFNAILTHYPKNALVIEGHFHQGIIHKNYLSLPSFACHKRVGRMKAGKVVFEKI